MQHGASSILVKDNNTSPKLSIYSMPNPDDITLGTIDVSKSSIHIPNIHDGNEKIITSDQYDKKIEDSSIVMLTVHLKLYALFIFFFILKMFHYYFRWPILP